MIYKYEIACREAGLDEEKTAEIRRMFDADYKKLRRRKEAKRKSGYVFLSVSQVNTEGLEGKDYQIPDASSNVEAEVLLELGLEQLREALAELPADDREFLLDAFEDEYNADERLSVKYGVSRWQIRYRRQKLIELLRERMGVDLKNN